MNFFIGNQIGSLNISGAIPEKITVKGLPEKSMRELQLLDIDVTKNDLGHHLKIPTNYQMGDYMLVLEIFNQFSEVSIHKKNQAINIEIHNE